MRNRIHITINGRPFAARLADTDAARAFAALLPLSLDMDDLHGNEKYHHLKTRLPARPEHPGTIRAGDLMLFGDNCVVLFYEDFSTNYSYTRLGRLENPAELAEVVGKGTVTVAFQASDAAL